MFFKLSTYLSRDKTVLDLFLFKIRNVTFHHNGVMTKTFKVKLFEQRRTESVGGFKVTVF